MATIRGRVKENLQRSVTAALRIQERLAPVYEEYKDDQPLFSDEVLTAIKYAEVLEEYVKLLQTKFDMI